MRAYSFRITADKKDCCSHFWNIFQFEGYDPKFEQTSLPTGMNMFAIYPGELWGTPEDRLVWKEQRSLNLIKLQLCNDFWVLTIRKNDWNANHFVGHAPFLIGHYGPLMIGQARSQHQIDIEARWEHRSIQRLQKIGFFLSVKKMRGNA